MRVNENQPRPAATPATPPPAAEAPAKKPAARGTWPRVLDDNFKPTKGGKKPAGDPGMGEEPQSQYGTHLKPGMEPHAAGLEKFMAQNEAKIDRLAQRLKSDPEYLKASAPGAWERMNPQQKKAFADHVSKLMGEELGFKPAKTELGWDKDKRVDGSYDDEDNKLELNRNADAFNNLNQFMNTVVHEQFHAYQNQLMKGQYPPDDPRHAASEAYKIDKRTYVEAPKDKRLKPRDYAAYRQQPSEAHAFTLGQRFYQRMTGAE